MKTDNDVDEAVIKDEITNILVAGRDTVSPYSFRSQALLTVDTDCCDIDIRYIPTCHSSESDGQTSG
jgi:hypothetical protein